MGASLWFILIGLVAGLLAGQLLKGGVGLGVIGELLVGVGGAAIGGFLFGELGVSSGGSFTGSLIAAAIGAVVLLLVLHQFRRA